MSVSEFEEIVNETTPTATLQMYDGILSTFARESGSANRASAANGCPRKRWYQNQGVQGEPITPRAICTFMQGDIAEKVIQTLIGETLVGEGKLYSRVSFGEPVGKLLIQNRYIMIYEQQTVHLRVSDTLVIPGHADGIGRRNSDGKLELIEIKSASDYGFQRFQNSAGGVGDYLRQAHALMLSDEYTALGVREVRFFYMRKSTGHVWDRLYSFDPEIAAQVIEEFKIAAGDTLPVRPYEPEPEVNRRVPTGRYKLPWQCSYCPYTMHCWKDENVNMEFKAGKPVFILSPTNKGE